MLGKSHKLQPSFGDLMLPALLTDTLNDINIIEPSATGADALPTSHECNCISDEKKHSDNDDNSFALFFSETVEETTIRRRRHRKQRDGAHPRRWSKHGRKNNGLRFSRRHRSEPPASLPHGSTALPSLLKKLFRH